VPACGPVGTTLVLLRGRLDSRADHRSSIRVTRVSSCFTEIVQGEDWKLREPCDRQPVGVSVVHVGGVPVVFVRVEVIIQP